MTAEYPTKVTTQLKTAVNNLSLNLTDDVGEDADEIFVGTTEGAPASGSFHIENEIIFYPAKTSIKFGPGLTRGADGTTKAVHLKTLAGGEVKFGPEAHFINNLNDEVIATQTKVGITGAFNFVGKTGDETIAGVKTLSNTPKMDAIAEKTADAGVTIDGLLIKDGDAGTITTTIASSAAPTPAIASRRTDYVITALAEAATFGAPTGSPINGYSLLIRIKDNGTARALSWNAIYRAGTDIAKPTTTVISKTLYVGLIYNFTDTKWDLMMVIEGF